MSTLTTKDGTPDLFTGMGHGTTVVFSHGWPSFRRRRSRTRCSISHSRGFSLHRARPARHGRSSSRGSGNDLDTYADDLAELVKHLDLKDAVHVGHSTGGGESPATSAARQQGALRRPS